MSDDPRRKDPGISDRERRDVARVNEAIERFSETRKQRMQRAGETPELLRLMGDLADADDAIDLVESEVITPEDLAYTHSLFLQCFMPLRHNPKNRQRWETGNRNAKLVIRAGELVKPDSPGDFKECIVPAGPKARLIVAYINDYAYRNKTQTVDLGHSLRQFMKRADVRIGGKNGKELQREIENVAAADIYLGVWTSDGSAHQRKAPVSEALSFWIDKNPDQRTFWQPEMTLSSQYYKSLWDGEHMAPLHWPGYVKLQHNARAMDVFAFLAYRLRKPIKKPVILRAQVLHAMFGRDIKLLKHFWPRFKEALIEALKHYPTARIEILKDAIKLYDSPPLIPYRKVGRLDAPPGV